MTTEERIKQEASIAIANHYRETMSLVSTGSVQIESVKQINQDDWRVRASCQRLSKELHFELVVYCNETVFDVLDFYQIGATK